MFAINENANKKLKAISKISGGKFDAKTVSFIDNKNDDDVIYKCFTEINLTDGKFEPM